MIFSVLAVFIEVFTFNTLLYFYEWLILVVSNIIRFRDSCFICCERDCRFLLGIVNLLPVSSLFSAIFYCLIIATLVCCWHFWNLAIYMRFCVRFINLFELIYVLIEDFINIWLGFIEWMINFKFSCFIYLKQLLFLHLNVK
jgi:hypothetical protein